MIITHKLCHLNFVNREPNPTNVTDADIEQEVSRPTPTEDVVSNTCSAQSIA